MKRRIISLLLTAAVAGTIISGCGKSEPVADVTEQETEQEIISGTQTVSEGFIVVEDTEDEAAAVSRNAMYLSEDTDMKSEPDENSETVETLKLGESVTAVGDSAEGWQNVETASNKTGYVKEDVLQTPSERDAQLEAERLLQEAEQEKKNEQAAQQNTASNSSSNSGSNNNINSDTQQNTPSTPDAVDPSTVTDNLTDQQKESLAEGTAGGHWTVNEDGNPSFVFEYHYGSFTSREEKDNSYTAEEREMVGRAGIIYSMGNHTDEALAEAKAAYPLVVFEFREKTAEYDNELDYAGAYWDYDSFAGCYVYYNKY